MKTVPQQFNLSKIELINHPNADSTKRRGIKLSIVSLSNDLSGFERGELVCITAPPAGGKSMLARTFAMDFLKQSLDVLYLSFEMTYSQLRRMFDEAGLSTEENKSLIYVPEDIIEKDIAFVEQMAAKHKPTLLVIDDFLSLEEKYAFNNDNNSALRLRGLAGRLKNIAIKNNIVVLTMLHMKKESLNNKQGSLADIGYSGGMAQVSDIVMQVTRDQKGGTVQITKSRETGKHSTHYITAVNKIFQEDIVRKMTGNLKFNDAEDFYNEQIR